MGHRQLEGNEGPREQKDYQAAEAAYGGGSPVKIKNVSPNNRKKAFEVIVNGKPLLFPYARLRVRPDADNRVIRAFVDPELGNEAFTYTLARGQEDSIHIDQVLEYNRDPNYFRDLLIYKLTVEAQKCLESSGLSRREIVRRLGTSASQFYRLVDQTNYRKSVAQLLALLNILDCEVDVVVKQKRSHGHREARLATPGI